MAASWRPFVRLKGEQASSSHDHNQEINQAASQDKNQDDHARGGLAGFLNDRCEVKGEGDGAVNDCPHHGPGLTDHDQTPEQQRGQYE